MRLALGAINIQQFVIRFSSMTEMQAAQSGLVVCIFKSNTTTGLTEPRVSWGLLELLLPYIFGAFKQMFPFPPVQRHIR